MGQHFQKILKEYLYLFLAKIRDLRPFLVKYWQQKWFRWVSISAGSLICFILFLLILAFTLPPLIRFFVPLDEASQKIIAKIEQDISDKKEKYQSVSVEVTKLKKTNKESKKKLLQRNLKILNLRIKLYQIKKNKNPTKKQIKRVLRPILLEPYSQSKVIYYDRNYLGGWYYDEREGELLNNFRN